MKEKDFIKKIFKNNNWKLPETKLEEYTAKYNFKDIVKLIQQINKNDVIGGVSKRYLIEVHTPKGNRLYESTIYDLHQAECVYKQAKQDFRGYLVTKIEIPHVC